MRRRPRPAQSPLLSPSLVWRVFFVSGLFAAGALAVFFHALHRGLDLDLARTMVVNAIVVFEIFYLFNVRYLNSTSITLRGVQIGRASCRDRVCLYVSFSVVPSYIKKKKCTINTK